ncbi:unnamed protein product [Brachionus calyciflorus]|uniref:Uncharacterized protein n=1 Tax=Brachionus calyciflorus TaxID=104777 RepID=A0A813RW31_9BILA|nr:unnamed protein product [Brachionus calyciflorus]
MGSDMSRPRQRRNASADAFRERGLKNMVCREVDYDCVDLNRRARRPCFSSQVDTVRRLPPVDPCIDPCRVSRCSTPNPCIPIQPNPCVNNYVDLPAEANKYYRPTRYQTLRPGYYKEDDYYPDPRQLSVKKSYAPYMYDDCDRISTKLPVDCEIIPAEKIYEIRKEKVLIKTDRSQSPPRIRSKSTDRYLEVPRSVRILNTESYRPAEKVYPVSQESDNVRSRLRSRSGYIEETHVRSESTERKIIDSSKLNSNQNTNKSQLCLNNEIIYVPMVREEFIKRESQKLISESDQGEAEYRRRPNKIIIREYEQPNLRSILKTNNESNGLNTDINESLLEKLIIDESKQGKSENRMSTQSDSKSSGYANLKYGIGKDGSLLYTYE